MNFAQPSLTSRPAVTGSAMTTAWAGQAVPAGCGPGRGD